MPNDSAQSPYDDIIDDLVKSIMCAQAELISEFFGPPESDQVSNEAINRHFCWLAYGYPLATNTHLFDAPDDHGAPLRTQIMRNPRALPSPLRYLLKKREPMPFMSGDDTSATVQNFMAKHPVVQKGSTRISRLIRSSFHEIMGDRNTHRSRLRSIPSARERPIFLKSPLAIAFDFLKVPGNPGSEAYALVTIRNFIFRNVQAFPDLSGDKDVGSFSSLDIEEAYSTIAKSFRPRFQSKGEDKLPQRARMTAGTVLRHFLAARDCLWLRFVSGRDDCARFLERGKLFQPIRSARSDGSASSSGATDVEYDFSRPRQLDHLPDVGEVTNQLWGLPVPIRGADTLFRGGLRFSARGGLIVAIQGGPGAGKTSLALAFCAYLSGFGIRSLFLTAEETKADLRNRTDALIPPELRSLSFFPSKLKDWLNVQPISTEMEADGSTGAIEGDTLTQLEGALEGLSRALSLVDEPKAETLLVPRVCRAIVVLDGVHDWITATTEVQGATSTAKLLYRLRKFVVRCRELSALVILTASEDWSGGKALDYLVDVGIRLSDDGIAEYGRKSERRVTLTKIRHQLGSIGSHGVLLSGEKGIRFSPQINYQLDRRAIWRARLPERAFEKRTFRRVMHSSEFEALQSANVDSSISRQSFYELERGISLYCRSNIFLNGEGSGGKAALALKIAASPIFHRQGYPSRADERILVISFLYPREHYEEYLDRVLRLRRLEYGDWAEEGSVSLEVIHLYPGHYLPDFLYNRINWRLDEADLAGAPFTSVIIDGIHNVFLQFPQIQRYSLFWPQLFSSLQSREIMIISTHTTFVLQGSDMGEAYRLDDERSEPLRHALVQKTDFRFEISAVKSEAVASEAHAQDRDVEVEQREIKNENADLFAIKTIAAIGDQGDSPNLYWSKSRLVLVGSRGEPTQRELPLLLPDSDFLRMKHSRWVR